MLRWIALLALCACGATPAPCPPAPVVPSGAPLLWRVYKAGGSTVWLVIARTAEPILWARNRRWLPKIEG